MVRSISAYIKADYSDNKHTRGSPCPSTAIAAYADLPPPSTQEQPQSPGSSGVSSLPITYFVSYHSDKLLAAGSRVVPRRGSHHEPVQGQATSLGFDAIRGHSTSIPDDFYPHLSKEQSSDSITSGKPSPHNDLMTLSVGDGIFCRKVTGRPPKRSRTELGGCDLERSSHELARSPSVVPESEDLSSDTGDSESESGSDTENVQDLGDRWEYRRIVARRIGPTGRRETLLEWEPTWEPEDEVGDVKRALRRYAKERRGPQGLAEELCPNCGAKKRKYDA